MPQSVAATFFQHTSFKDHNLSIPGYSFPAKAVPWNDVGSMTLLAEGRNLKDGAEVLAKIAPAHSDGSLCLQREAHALGRLNASSEATTALRLLEHIVIPQKAGDCVVLVIGHPGLNQLGRYFAPPPANELLLPEPLDKSAGVNSASISTLNSAKSPEPITMDFGESTLMDLASFLEFAIQATHCLEVLHKHGFVHREVRVNAFHLNANSGAVRLVHFGNRAISLEQFGGPSPFVLRAEGTVGKERDRVRDAMITLAPEQTGALDVSAEDHRTDLYSLGIVLWMTLAGGSALPFESGPLELLNSITQIRPRPIHEIRRDVPLIVSAMIDKLLSKHPDARYNSAAGLQTDLIECQKRLNASVSVVSDQSTEVCLIFEVPYMQ